MTDELIFYTHPQSRGRIIRWMLEEIGQPYHTELLEYGTTMKAPAYLAINPMGKVPAIRHGDTVVTEAAAICAYLADAFPEARLAPPPGDRLPARGGVDQQGDGLCRAAGAREDDGLRTLRTRRRRARGRGVRSRVCGRRQVHRRRCLSRVRYRVWHADWCDREAPRL